MKSGKEGKQPAKYSAALTQEERFRLGAVCGHLMLLVGDTRHRQECLELLSIGERKTMEAIERQMKEINEILNR